MAAFVGALSVMCFQGISDGFLRLQPHSFGGRRWRRVLRETRLSESRKREQEPPKHPLHVSGLKYIVARPGGGASAQGKVPQRG